jgi:predicted Zn-ribbon and HTH transcriptional regulator
MKNLIYGGIIALCLIIAAVVVFTTRSGGSSGVDSLSDETRTWVICAACGASYEMGEKEFYTQVREKTAELANPMVQARLTCQKCGKDMVVKAVKCPKCGEVFPEGIVLNDFDDRCPKCKFSATEEKRKANRANQG